ncbi:MAG: DUF1737 domain-containing protein [Opitutaceae bacterium]|nr:DUF1737 domain-containing protein [Cytophagales bacterium]
MKKVLQYNVLRNQILDELVKDIQTKIEDGWELQGGICYGYGGEYSDTWAQAIVLYDKTINIG